MDQSQMPVFKPLWHLISREKVKIETLASAIEDHGIQGWDRFGRFKTFTSGSTGDDAVRYAYVLNVLAKQHQCDEVPTQGRSPLDEAEDYAGSGHAFEYGWPEGHAALDFSAIVAAAAGQPAEPTKQSSGNGKGENYNLNLIGALVGFITGEISPNAHPDYDKAGGMKKLGKLLANKYDTASAEVYARRLSVGVQAMKDAQALKEAID